ncbi:MAG: branched-chain amino acid ABC transporter permease, partial [Pseudomonadota bacterium]
MLTTTLIAGLVLGGTYALVAMGLTIQYGIARTMNLAYGETIIAAAFAAYLVHNNLGISPILGLVLIAPAGFAFGWLVYGLLLRPLVRRSKGGAALEIDSILATFGLLFVIQGVMQVGFGGNYISYSYMNFGVEILGASVAANRLLALVLALAIGGGLYLLLTYTRWGTALRAVAVAPASAPLVGIDA